MIPIALVQAIICYAIALPLGLDFTPRIVWAVLSIPAVALVFIGLGLLCGSVFGVKQVGGVCGALLTNLSAWLSGVWFDLSLVGGFFERIANMLPFVHAVQMEKALLSGNFEAAAGHFLLVAAYGAVVMAAAVYCFLQQMKRQ